MATAYVGLGANLGEPATALHEAAAALGRLPGTRLLAVSSLYRSAPVDVPDRQPDYLNAVAELETALSPQALLAALHEIEHDAGRRRHAPNAARLLDLDLLLYGTLRLDDGVVTVPHPRMHSRAFVLRPLLEIAPDVAIPGRGPARALLDAVAGQRVERVAGATDAVEAAPR